MKSDEQVMKTNETQWIAMICFENCMESNEKVMKSNEKLLK